MGDRLELEFDADDFLHGLDRAEKIVADTIADTDDEVGETLLLLSQREVPLDESTLANTGETHREGGADGETIVGYHTDYAARLHEHPEYSFGNNRKGKYLEDPLKNNLNVFGQQYADNMDKAL